MSVKTTPRRIRRIVALILAVVIAAGLLSRRFPDILPAWFAKSAGDTLYAVAGYLAIAALFPTLPTARAALAALLYSYSIEFSQLYHAPWIDSVRHTKLGGLILGFGFSWKDMACYTVGVGAVAICESIVFQKRRNASSQSQL